MIATLASSPLSYPRFLFQSLQQTSLKLAVTPVPRGSGETIPVPASQQFAIKVEGVISANGVAGKRNHRSVEKVLIALNSTLVQPKAANVNNLDFRKNSGEFALEQSVVPHNDFFSAQFLVPFPIPGVHQVVIGTHLVDLEGRQWKCSERVTLNIKAFEDNQSRPGMRPNR